MDTQVDYLEQTRTSWLSIGRNYTEEDPNAQGPALVLLGSRLDEFGRELGRIGNLLIAESETNNLADARFIYRFGTTLAAWGQQQREVLLDNCGRIGRTSGTNIFNVFNQGRELFSLALTDSRLRRVLAVLEGAFETDVLATRCESARAATNAACLSCAAQPTPSPPSPPPARGCPPATRPLARRSRRP